MRKKANYFFFFFSSRRRHTIYWRDWSSDVCSSDLPPPWRRSERPRALARGAEPRDARPAAPLAARTAAGRAGARARRRPPGPVVAVAPRRPLDAVGGLSESRSRARLRAEDGRPGDADARDDPPRVDARLPPFPPRPRGSDPAEVPAAARGHGGAGAERSAVRRGRAGTGSVCAAPAARRS